METKIKVFLRLSAIGFTALHLLFFTQVFAQSPLENALRDESHRDEIIDSAVAPEVQDLVNSQGPARTEEARGLVPGTFDINFLKTDGQISPKDRISKGAGGVTQVVIDAIDLLIKFIGAIALVVFILGALLTIMSEGKEDRLEKGKNAMVYSLIGVAIAFFSFIIVAFVQSILF